MKIQQRQRCSGRTIGGRLPAGRPALVPHSGTSAGRQDCPTVRAIIGVSLLLFLPAIVLAQTAQQGFVSTMSATATLTNYSFARPNDATIIVNVMGQIPRPGRYEIAKSIDLMNLLALAGGPTTEGTLSSVQITRRADIDGKVRFTDIFIDLDELSAVPPSHLVLQPGDVIMVTRSGWMTVRDVFNVVVGASIIVAAVAQVIYATK